MDASTMIRLPRTPSSQDPSPAGPHRPVDARGLALTVLAVLAAIFALQWARPFLVPTLFGILISYVLQPIVRGLVRWRIPHPLATTLVLVSAVACVGALCYLLSFQAMALADRLPLAAQEVREALQARRASAPGPVEQVQKAAEELQKISGPDTAGALTRGKVATLAIEKKAFDFRDYLWAGSVSFTTFIGDTVIALFLAFYLLLAGDLFRQRLVEIAGPTLRRRKVTLEILDAIGQQISRYLFVRVLISAMVAAGTFAAFWAIGLAEPGVWGVAAGLLNVIPYLGPASVAAGAAVAAFLQFHTLTMVAVTAGLAIGVATIEAYLVTPWLMSRTAEMNPAAVFIALIFWGWLWGLPGLFLAVPIMMVVKSVCDHIDRLEPVATLLKR